MEIRTASFGEHHKLTFADKIGVWLSNRRIIKLARAEKPEVVADIGCGFEARLIGVLPQTLKQYIAVDVSLSSTLSDDVRIKSIEGLLPEALNGISTGSVDLVILNSVIEHLDDPELAIRECLRIIKPGGVIFLNVPTWLGKIVLEFLAFRLSLSPAIEMNDHKNYYDKRDLWRVLRKGGVLPMNIKVRRHKFLLNVFAIGRIEKTSRD
jgi:SAM-dependent methyltransferase